MLNSFAYLFAFLKPFWLSDHATSDDRIAGQEECARAS